MLFAQSLWVSSSPVLQSSLSSATEVETKEQASGQPATEWERRAGTGTQLLL